MSQISISPFKRLTAFIIALKTIFEKVFQKEMKFSFNLNFDAGLKMGPWCDAVDNLQFYRKKIWQ